MNQSIRAVGALSMQLPECYSWKLDECLRGAAPNDYPNCALMRQEIAANPEGEFHAAIIRVPTCEADRPRIEATLAQVPNCYSQALDYCLNTDDPDSSSLPNCRDINTAYNLDSEPFVSLPFCDEPQETAVPWGMLVATGAAGALLGFFIGKIV